MTINLPKIIKEPMEKVASDLDNALTEAYPNYEGRSVSHGSSEKSVSEPIQERPLIENTEEAPIAETTADKPASEDLSDENNSSKDKNKSNISPNPEEFDGEKLSVDDVNSGVKKGVNWSKENDIEENIKKFKNIKSNLSDNGEINSKKLNDQMDNNNLIHFYLAIIEMMQKILTSIAKWCLQKMGATARFAGSIPKNLKDVVTGIGATYVNNGPVSSLDKPLDNRTSQENLADLDKDLVKSASDLAEKEGLDAVKNPADLLVNNLADRLVTGASNGIERSDELAPLTTINSYGDDRSVRGDKNDSMVSDDKDNPLVELIDSNKKIENIEGIDEFSSHELNDGSNLILTDAENSAVKTKVGQMADEIMSGIGRGNIKNFIDYDNFNAASSVNKFISGQINDLGRLRKSFKDKADTLEVNINNEIMIKAKLLNVDFNALKSTILYGSDAENMLFIKNDRQELIRKNEILLDLRTNVDMLYVAAQEMVNYSLSFKVNNSNEDQIQQVTNIKNEFENLFVTRNTSKHFIDNSQLGSFLPTATIAQSIEVQKECDDSQGIEGGAPEAGVLQPIKLAEESALLTGNVCEIRNGIMSQRPVDASKLELIHKVFSEVPVADTQASDVSQDELGEKSNFSRPKSS